MDIVELYKEYYKELYNYVYAMTLNKYDTEDIVQCTFFKAMKGLIKYRGEASIKTWLFKIARNECSNYFRNHSQYIDIDSVIITTICNLDEKLCLKEEIKKIAEFILNEKEPIRSLLILRLVDEYSFKNISDILEQSENWCRVTFYRTKKKMLDFLEQDSF